MLPPLTGVPGRRPVCAAAQRGDGAGDLVGVRQARQGNVAGDLGGELRAPRLPLKIVQRTEQRRRVVVQHVLAGQAVDEIRAGAAQVTRAGEDVRLVAAQPENLGADRLRVEVAAAQCGQRIGAVSLLQRGDLGRGARVDAVQDGRAQRTAGGVQHGQVRPQGADAQRRHLLAGHVRLDQQRARDAAHVAPPHGVGVLLGPARLRHRQPVFHRMRRHHPAARRAQHALRAEGADVNAHQELCVCHKDPSPEIFCAGAL